MTPKYLLASTLLSLVLFNLLPGLTLAAPTEVIEPAFQNTWDRVDKPVNDIPGLGRGYTWGPTLDQARKLTTEPYNNSRRKVQYFDKARMEINNPQGNTNDLFYVTTGLLVKELVTGNLQIGDSAFVPLLPSTIPVAGDPNDAGGNPIAPTYASFREVVTFNGAENSQPSQLGQTINSQLNKAGGVLTIIPPEQRLLAGYDDITRHNLADVFIQYGNQVGLVWNGIRNEQGSVFFGNPTYVLGRPVSEPYWVRAVVAGTEKWVLVQLFERRVLTYTPDNPEGFKVEMGNVGQHYFKWRYQLSLAVPRLVVSGIYQPALGGNWLIWIDAMNKFQAKNLISGEQLSWGPKPYPEYGLPCSFFGLVSDGQTVVWYEQFCPTPSVVRAEGYDLNTHQEFEIPGISSPELAVNNGVVYNADHRVSQRIISYNIAKNQEQTVVNASVDALKVKGNFLVYSTPDTSNSPGQSRVGSLHVVKLDGSRNDIILTASLSDSQNFDLDENFVVWTQNSPSNNIEQMNIYNIRTGESQIITSQPCLTTPGNSRASCFSRPAISNGQIAYFSHGSLLIYNPTTGITHYLLKDQAGAEMDGIGVDGNVYYYKRDIYSNFVQLFSAFIS